MPHLTFREITFLMNINEWDHLTEEDCRYFLKVIKRFGPETKKVAEQIERNVEEGMEEEEMEKDASET